MLRLGLPGNTFVVEAGEEYRLLGVNSLDVFALATPAIVGDRLLIRTQSHLYSFVIAAEPGARSQARG